MQIFTQFSGLHTKLKGRVMLLSINSIDTITSIGIYTIDIWINALTFLQFFLFHYSHIQTFFGGALLKGAALSSENTHLLTEEVTRVLTVTGAQMRGYRET